MQLSNNPENNECAKMPEVEQDQYIDECDFSHANLKHEITINLCKYDGKDKHLVVSSGINLKGVCFNSDCEAYNKQSWIKLGFGVFNIQTVRFQNPCQSCGQTIESQSIKTFGYTRAKVSLKGIMYQKKKEVKKQWSGTEQKGQLKYFDDNDSYISQWGLLQVTAQRLQ